MRWVMFNIVETFKDEDALNLIELINEYIKSVLIKKSHICK